MGEGEGGVREVREIVMNDSSFMVRIQDGGVHGDGSSAQLSTPPLLTNLSNHRLGWKTDLAATVPFWSGRSMTFERNHHPPFISPRLS